MRQSQPLKHFNIEHISLYYDTRPLSHLIVNTCSDILSHSHFHRRNNRDARFEVLTAVSLKIQDFSNIMLCRWVNSYGHTETPGTVYPGIQSNIQDSNLQ